jgi:hypothetical protein
MAIHGESPWRWADGRPVPKAEPQRIAVRSTSALSALLSGTCLAIGKHRDLQEKYDVIIWYHMWSMETVKYIVAATSGGQWLGMALGLSTKLKRLCSLCSPVEWIRRGPHVVSIQCRLHQITTGIKAFCLDPAMEHIQQGLEDFATLYWWNDGFSSWSLNSRTSSVSWDKHEEFRGYWGKPILFHVGSIISAPCLRAGFENGIEVELLRVVGDGSDWASSRLISTPRSRDYLPREWLEWT